MTSRREILKYAGLGVGAATASALGLPVNAKVAVNQAPHGHTEQGDATGRNLRASPRRQKSPTRAGSGSQREPRLSGQRQPKRPHRRT